MHHPTATLRKLVEILAAHGATEVEIARTVGIGEKTLRRHYRDELDRGHVVANIKVAENLLKIATGDEPEAVTACIFWLKARAGWNTCGPPRPQ